MNRRIVRAAQLMAACAVALNCDRGTVQPAVPAAQAQNLQPLPLTGVARSATSVPVFEALGYLDEYTGRSVAHGSDRVERFYLYEAEVAKDFRSLLLRIGHEQGIDERLREEREDSGIVFYSAPLADLLNSMYLDRRSHSFAEDKNGGLIPVWTLHVTPEMFRGVDRVRKHAYLTGVYRRNGRGHSVTFTNAAHKAALVARLLTEEGCAPVEVRKGPEGFIPGATSVTFAGCETLLATIRVIP